MALNRWSVALLALGLILLAAPAAAHTAFDSSTPADGATVDEPVSTIEIRFTGTATPVGETFSVFTPAGDVITPAWTTSDGRTFVLTFDPPLAGGDVGVRWEVQAADTHPISGSFSFVVLAPALTTSTSTTTTTIATTTTESNATSTEPAPTTSAAPSTTAPPSAEDDAPADLEDFLASEASDDRDWRHGAGRWLGYAGSLLTIGTLVFAGVNRSVGSVAGSPLLRVGGAMAALGAVVHGWGLADQAADPSNGQVGAVALLALAAVLVLAVASLPVHMQTIALAGASAAFAIAPGLEGHSVTEGPRAVHAAVSAVHVVAAGAWAGGLIALIAVWWSERHEPTRHRLSRAVATFSRVATIALAAVVGAGLAMTIIILDEVGDLTDTAWGRTMLVKLVLVGGAAVIGALNHFVFGPRLAASAHGTAASATLVRLIGVEVALLTLATMVTVRLVNASIV